MIEKTVWAVLLIVLALAWVMPVGGQDNGRATAYQEAIQGLESAKESGWLSLNLTYLSLTGLAPRINELKNLKQLYLSGFYESDLPFEIAQFPDITRLGISNAAHLTEFPSGIDMLSKLETLSLSATALSSVPPEIGQLRQLTWLSFYGSPLQRLPPEIGQLAHLENLDLSFTKLTTLPPEIEQLDALQQLTIQGSPLQSLPAEIGELARLETLYLTYTHLTSLPPEIGQLDALQYLFLQSSPLRSLPPEIGQLSNLKYLDITNTEITTLPIELGHLNNLEEIYSQARHLTFPPPDIVAQGTPAILAYLRDHEAMLMRKTISAIATGIGVIGGIILLFRWRWRGLSEKKKRV